MAEVVQRRYTLLLLFLVSMFNYIDRTIISILQVPIKRDLALSDAQLGALTGLSFAIVYSTLCLPVARWADRGNRARIVTGSLALWSAMTALTGFAGGFLALVVLRLGVAAGEAGSVPSTHSIIADLYPPRERATVLALWGLSLPAGMAFGYLFAGQLERMIGWRDTFLVIGLAGIALAPVVLWTMREPQRGRFDAPAQHAVPAGDLNAALRHLWRLKAFRYLVLAGTCHAYAVYATMNWNAPFYGRVHGMALTDVALYLALLNGIGSAIGMYLGGRLSDRAGRHDAGGRLRVVAWALLAMVPFALAQYLVASPTLSIVFGAFASILMMFYFGPIVAVPQLLVPPGMRALTSAVVIITFNLLGLGLGPFCTGLLSDFLAPRLDVATDSVRYALCAATLFSILGGVLFLVAARHLSGSSAPAGVGAAAERCPVPR